MMKPSVCPMLTQYGMFKMIVVFENGMGISNIKSANMAVHAVHFKDLWATYGNFAVMASVHFVKIPLFSFSSRYKGRYDTCS